jgi:hypothetical protein
VNSGGLADALTALTLALDDVANLLLVHGRAMNLRRVRAVVTDTAAALGHRGRRPLNGCCEAGL